MSSLSCPARLACLTHLALAPTFVVLALQDSRPVPSPQGPPKASEKASPHEDLRQEQDRRIPTGETGWVSGVFRPKRRFNEVLPSWNLDVAKGAGVQVELQVGDAEGWSPWMHIGDWGVLPALERRTRCARGKVRIDIFEAKALLDRARLRFRVYTGESTASKPGECTLRRLHLCFSNTLAPIRARPPSKLPDHAPLEVPLIRQGEAPKKISSLVCSPTSVTMVLRYHGKKAPLAETCAGIRDPHHGLYGVWNRAVQYAWTQGLPGYLTRIASWDRVLEHTAAGRPLVISLAWKKGELRNCAFPFSPGHLIVILGLTKDGKQVVCADPGADPHEKVRRLYYREDLDKAWIARGGYTYVLAH